MSELRVGPERTFECDSAKNISYFDEEHNIAIQLTSTQRDIMAQAIAIVKAYEKISDIIEEVQNDIS